MCKSPDLHHKSNLPFVPLGQLTAIEGDISRALHGPAREVNRAEVHNWAQRQGKPREAASSTIALSKIFAGSVNGHRSAPLHPAHLSWAYQKASNAGPIGRHLLLSSRANNAQQGCFPRSTGPHESFHCSQTCHALFTFWILTCSTNSVHPGSFAACQERHPDADLHSTCVTRDWPALGTNCSLAPHPMLQ